MSNMRGKNRFLSTKKFQFCSFFSAFYSLRLAIAGVICNVGKILLTKEKKSVSFEFPFSSNACLCLQLLSTGIVQSFGRNCIEIEIEEIELQHNKMQNLKNFHSILFTRFLHNVHSVLQWK